MLLYECGELGTGKMLEQLIEEARDLYDWNALLWAAFGEAPAKDWLANVNYRRASLLFQTARTCLGQECSVIYAMFCRGAESLKDMLLLDRAFHNLKHSILLRSFSLTFCKSLGRR